MSVLALRDVSYRYRNATRETLSHVNYSFERGTFYALLGKSGAGKSTLLSLLAGLDTPSSGAILFEDEPLNAQRLHTHRRDHIALVFQNYNLIDYLTPLENIRLVNKHANADILPLSQCDARNALSRELFLRARHLLCAAWEIGRR